MITEDEFKEVFKLDADCTVPKDTLKRFTKQIKGAYLLYEEAKDVKNVKFHNIDGTELHAYFDPHFGSTNNFQGFVYTLGSKHRFRVTMLDSDGRSVPFWTNNRYSRVSSEKNTQMKNSAYGIFETTVLYEWKFKYSKYGITIEYRDGARGYFEGGRAHPNQAMVWDGINFNPLYFINGNHDHIELNNYNIRNVITNRTNIFIGRLPEPISKIIDGVSAS